MENKNKNLLVICVRISKWLFIPAQRIRKLKKRINMRQLKIAVLVLGAGGFIVLLMYYLHRSAVAPTPAPRRRFPVMTSKASNITHAHDQKYIAGTPMRHVPLDEAYNEIKGAIKVEDEFSEETKPLYIINQPGCQIPFATVNYEKYINAAKKKKISNCGRRAVFLNKIDGNHVRASIETGAMRKYLSKSARFDCCLKFIERSTLPGHEYTKIQFTKCVKFINGAKITLKSDFVNVRCSEYDARNMSRPVYDDVYAFSNRLDLPPRGPTPTCAEYYNVLMVGIDSMSLQRFVQTMPLTANYLYENFWLCLRGFNKVGDNTLPNLMAVLTGRNMEMISNRCQGKMDQCNDFLMWSQFKKNGYVTAYGEDFLRLPDTFSKGYEYRAQPTDHYIRPLFLKGETELNNKSTVCSGKASSGQQLLDYATDFVTTYRHDRFFGVFWMNSFSHNENSRPQDADRIFENFFNKIYYTGILEKTFVIFFSDHGIRFGQSRISLESYYEERLPIFFIWVPTKFKGKHEAKYKSVALNQFRLVTPYDLFSTLINVQNLSRCENLTDNASPACPNCQSLFNPVNTSRQCQDVAVHDKWCSCHRLYPLELHTDDTDGMKSVFAAVAHIKALIKSIKTKHCWQCLNVSLKNVIRIHFYYDNNKIKNLYYVVAFTTKPGNMSYEATVQKSRLIGTMSVISPYRGLGHCASEGSARLYCICQKVQNCK